MKGGAAAAVGMFDGLHAGHRFLLGNLRREAKLRGLRSEVFTFPRHPLGVVNPAAAPRLLSEPAEKLRLLEEAGFPRDCVNFLVFDEQMRSMTADRFMAMLRHDYGVEMILRGFNNRFGTERNLTPDDYRLIAASHGIELIDDCVSFAETGGKKLEVSSSRVRALLCEGDVSAAALLLGRPYSLAGTVVVGKRLGRQIGFPTANIAVSHRSKLIPARGVYICMAEIIDVQSPCGESGAAPLAAGPMRAMVNIGSRPTVDPTGAAPSIEAHIPGFDGDLYGRELRISFLSRLRDERKFPSLEALELQLALDCEETKKFILPD